jgi:hypothetical protein
VVRDLVGRLVLRVTLVNRGQEEMLEPRAPQDKLVNQDNQALQVPEAKMDSQDRRELQELLVQPDHKVRRVNLVHKVNKVHRGSQALLVPLDLRVREEKQVPQDKLPGVNKDSKDYQDPRAHKAQQVSPVH